MARIDFTTHYLKSFCFLVLRLFLLSSWVSSLNENYFHFFHLGLKRHLFGSQRKS
ncbi:hypothetical protein PRBEI_2001626400 [Prionailurus iriomotensis]